MPRGTQFGGDGEGHHKIGHGKQASLLFGCPSLLVERTALRATPVVAAVIGVVVFATPHTAVDPPAHHRGPAFKHATHRPTVGGAYAFPVITEVIPPMITQDV